MAPRPYCLQCGSSNAMMDEDVLNGMRSIYCYICGNRQYQGMDYVGFEMREEGSMVTRTTCKNCKRPDMIIVNQGHCFPCAKVSKKHPDPGPERDAAMAEVAERTKSMSGARTYKKRTDKAHLSDSPATPPTRSKKLAGKSRKSSKTTKPDPSSHPDPLTKPAGPTTQALLQRGIDALSSSACGKSHNPYTYCPLVFQHEDFAIGQYVILLVSEVRRIGGLPIGGGNHEEAQKIDACISSITAYMNGRIHEALLNPKGDTHVA